MHFQTLEDSKHPTLEIIFKASGFEHMNRKEKPVLSKTKIIHLDGDLTSQYSVGSRVLFKRFVCNHLSELANVSGTLGGCLQGVPFKTKMVTSQLLTMNKQIAIERLYKGQ